MSLLSVQPNERITFRTVFEDEHLLVVEKPSGVVTHPGVGHERDTLLNGLFAHAGARLQNLGEKRDWGLVHRLDKETSGLVMVALTAAAWESLTGQIRARSVGKFYWAICRQSPRPDEGVIRLSLTEQVLRTGRYTAVKVAKVSRQGKPAMTAYRLIEASELAALVEARPITGRLHQIRVHLHAIGCTVLGDDHYGSHAARGRSHRLALHAHRLTFEHPAGGEPLDLRTRFPKDLRPVLKRLGLHRPDVPATGA